MLIARPMMRYHLLQGQKQIVDNRRVRIFIYGNRRSCVRAIDNYIAISYTRLFDSRANLACNIHQLVTLFGADAEICLDDFHWLALLHLFHNLYTQKLA